MLDKALQRRGFDGDQNAPPKPRSGPDSFAQLSLSGHDGTIEGVALHVDWVFPLAARGEKT
jgi:hypothetical protein